MCQLPSATHLHGAQEDRLGRSVRTTSRQRRRTIRGLRCPHSTTPRRKDSEPSTHVGESRSIPFKPQAAGAFSSPRWEQGLQCPSDEAEAFPSSQWQSVAFRPLTAGHLQSRLPPPALIQPCHQQNHATKTPLSSWAKRSVVEGSAVAVSAFRYPHTPNVHTESYTSRNP